VSFGWAIVFSSLLNVEKLKILIAKNYIGFTVGYFVKSFDVDNAITLPRSPTAL
jgi:hypothetical protein